MAGLQLPGLSSVLIEPQRPTAGLWVMDNKKSHGREEKVWMDIKVIGGGRRRWRGGGGVLVQCAPIVSARRTGSVEETVRSPLRLTQLIWAN